MIRLFFYTYKTAYFRMNNTASTYIKGVIFLCFTTNYIQDHIRDDPDRDSLRDTVE